MVDLEHILHIVVALFRTNLIELHTTSGVFAETFLKIYGRLFIIRLAFGYQQLICDLTM